MVHAFYQCDLILRGRVATQEPAFGCRGGSGSREGINYSLFQQEASDEPRAVAKMSVRSLLSLLSLHRPQILVGSALLSLSHSRRLVGKTLLCLPLRSLFHGKEKSAKKGRAKPDFFRSGKSLYCKLAGESKASLKLFERVLKRSRTLD